MNKLILIFLCVFLVGCQERSNNSDTLKELEKLLDNWHKAASDANADAYFSKMDSVSVFIGTDASENWTLKEFKKFSLPYFNKGKAWSFKAVDRNLYLSKDNNYAWFDELLSTWMGACRGSGILIKNGNQWKIKHYVLSVTVPNEDIQSLISLKAKKDSIYLKSLVR